MRDPLGPIPSPAAPTPIAERFWFPTALPPPPPAPHVPLDEAAHGIDRRSTTPADHEPVDDRILGLRSRHGWSLCRALTLCPAGLLVRGVDLLDPQQAEASREAFAALAPLLSRSPPSLLGLVGGCVIAPRLVEDLAHWGSLRRPTAGRRSAAVAVTLLVPPLQRRAGDPPALAIDGTLAPMTDPSPDVLAVALAPEEHTRLRPHLVATPT